MHRDRQHDSRHVVLLVNHTHYQFTQELFGIIAPTHRAYDEFPVAPTSLYKAYDALDRYHLFV